MQTFLTILLILAALAALGALIRGIIIFLRTGHENVHGSGPSASSLGQNKAMRMRIMFQALAVIIAVLLLMLARGG